MEPSSLIREIVFEMSVPSTAGFGTGAEGADQSRQGSVEKAEQNMQAAMSGVPGKCEVPALHCWRLFRLLFL